MQYYLTQLPGAAAVPPCCKDLQATAVSPPGLCLSKGECCRPCSIRTRPARYESVSRGRVSASRAAVNSIPVYSTSIPVLYICVRLTTGRLRWVGHYILSPESLDCMTGDPKATSAVPEKELL
jgi:hypothetical protein